MLQLLKKYEPEGKSFAHFLFSEIDTERVMDQAFEMLQYNDFAFIFFVRDNQNLLPLHYGAQRGSISVLKHLFNLLTMKDIKSMITSKSMDGSTPLHLAAIAGRTEIMEFFLLAVDYNTRLELLSSLNFSQETPLLLVAENHGVLLRLLKCRFIIVTLYTLQCTGFQSRRVV